MESIAKTPSEKRMELKKIVKRDITKDRRESEEGNEENDEAESEIDERSEKIEEIR